MKKLLRSHPEAFLTVLALAFLCGLFFSFSWGIEEVITQVNRAVNATGTDAGSVQFDLKGARALNIPGLAR